MFCISIVNALLCAVNFDSSLIRIMHVTKNCIIMKEQVFSVYPIVNGCSREFVFSGSEDECSSYVRSHVGDFIVIPDPS